MMTTTIAIPLGPRRRVLRTATVLSAGVCLPTGLRPGVPAGVSYAPPANYRHSYNNVNVRNNVNVNINNNTNNYFNRFNNNQNLRGGSAQSPLASTRQAGDRESRRSTGDGAPR